MDVYEPHGNDTGLPIGVLTKVNDDEAPILMKAHHYIVGKTIKVRKKRLYYVYYIQTNVSK